MSVSQSTRSLNLTIIGTGFVGVVSAAVYAHFGNQVYGLDIDKHKIDLLKDSQIPFFEPGLAELLQKTQKTGRLKFTTNYQKAISQADVILIAVGTPSAPSGNADLKYVLAASVSLAPYLKQDAIVVVKSTVPPGTLAKVAEAIKTKTKRHFYLASLPEFLKEGTAVADTLKPDRIVIGATDPFVFQVLEALHQPFGAPIVKISPESAQMAKYAANNFLATRITFANQLADLCEKNGADIDEVIKAIGYDQRIGAHYWYPGFGYGGSCFPKDVKELAAYSRTVGEADNLFNKIDALNETRIAKLLDHYEKLIGGFEHKKVAVLGLSFKPNTNDMRVAPSTKVIPLLIEKGAEVVGYDPKASWLEFGLPQLDNFQQLKTIEAALENVDVIFVLIEWPEIVQFDYGKIRQKNKPQWLIDARNQLDIQQVQKWGFNYLAIGKSVKVPSYERAKSK